MSRDFMILGVDENGLGPRLGPMIVTGVGLRLSSALSPASSAYRSAAFEAGIGDSKAACAHGDMADVEAFVLAVLDVHLALRAATFDQLCDALCIDALSERVRLCPDGDARRPCFDDAIALPAFGDGPRAAERDRALALRSHGVELVAARFASICARRLNHAREKGRSRFDVDLDSMVRVLHHLRTSSQPGDTVHAMCGKVGGRKSYASSLEPLSALVAIEHETPERSAYRLAGFGMVEFVMDGDASEPSIGLASLLGKYVRELAMLRFNRFWAAQSTPYVPVSGYHDPVTDRMVRATRAARRRLAIAPDCFER